MARTLEENLKEIIGSFVMQLAQAQTQIAQLLEQLKESEAKCQLMQQQPAQPSAPESKKD